MEEKKKSADAFGGICERFIIEYKLDDLFWMVHFSVKS
jgi:hypothetical protein